MDILRLSFWPLMTAMIIMSMVSFTAFGLDKRRARNDRWRIREKTLFILCACMGAAGGLFGMQVFHHKTRKAAFRAVIPLLTALQAGLVILAGLAGRL